MVVDGALSPEGRRELRAIKPLIALRAAVIIRRRSEDFASPPSARSMASTTAGHDHFRL
jgi:hypothetical protein